MAPSHEAHLKMIRARTGLILAHPFFGHLSLRLKLREDRSCDTAWSDGRVLAYNPHYIDFLAPESVQGLVGHLVMHAACRHHLRRGDRHPRHWNMACDYAINWLLIEAGLSLPEGYLDDPQLRGQTADEIYVHLFDGNGENRSETPRQNNGDPEPPEPAADGESTESQPRTDDTASQNSSEESESRPADNSVLPDDNPRTTDEAHGDGDPGKSGEIRDAPQPKRGASAAGDEQEVEKEWRIALTQAVSQTKSMGDLPAGLSRLIHELLSPRLDWRQLLSRFISATARCDYAWMPPNRRYLHRGVYLPSMRSDDLPEIVVAVDTSGSVSEGELAQFAAELSGILETASLTVHLLYCDMQVTSSATITRQDLPLELNPTGNGGTDFRPAFDWVDRNGIHPRCLVYLTDLACNRYPREPSYPVLWAHMNEAPERPPFGDIVRIT